MFNPREFYFKAGSGVSIKAIAGFDFSPVELDDVMHDGKAQSCATSVPAASLVHSEESFKNALLVLFWNPVASVFYCNLYQGSSLFWLHLLNLDVDLGAWGTIFYRIVYDVAQGLAHEAGICRDVNDFCGG